MRYATVSIFNVIVSSQKRNRRKKRDEKSSSDMISFWDFNRAAPILFTISTPVKYYIITPLEYICISVLKGTLEQFVIQVKHAEPASIFSMFHWNVISTVASTGLNVSLVSSFAARWPPRMLRYIPAGMPKGWTTIGN